MIHGLLGSAQKVSNSSATAFSTSSLESLDSHARLLGTKAMIQSAPPKIQPLRGWKTYFTCKLTFIFHVIAENNQLLD